ncbi:molybdopterin-synthase adenylyltransferase MoeB [Pararhizobium mangrovi]|uniref:Molybdopterin-synthase adenylyltransferase n=1 Tax=Pararhizobium mangrovi TaxID=2590452 RepID=A0A506U0H6_9HYPH|nr:molybdopterin-synthase adenylyltransferase MoeB [Pararhizobium mangrovi]TPW26099.1 molybdopterin-synthase adenylyltransferase MoeB [Pararhizobium mangrovi]
MSEDDPALSRDELERYARHIVLPEIGGPGQQRLKRARVLVVGAGGLGAPSLTYLAAAGVGHLSILDDDRVSLSNLQRQFIHDTDAVGTGKAESAARSLARLNPHVRVEPVEERLTEANAPALMAGHDLVLDGSDNFETRYAVADMAAAGEIALVTGAVGRFDGSLTVLKPFERDGQGRRNPTYRDLFPTPPPPHSVPSCAEAGVVGALTGVIGSLMAMEAIKVLTGAGEPLVGRLLLYDALSARFETMTYRASAE